MTRSSEMKFHEEVLSPTFYVGFSLKDFHQTFKLRHP